MWGYLREQPHGSSRSTGTEARSRAGPLAGCAGSGVRRRGILGVTCSAANCRVQVYALVLQIVSALFNEEKCIPIHLLIESCEHFDRKTCISYRREDIHSQGLGTWTGHCQIPTLLSCSRAFIAKPTFVHKKQKGFLVANEEGFSLDRKQREIHLSAPFLPVVRVIKFHNNLQYQNMFVFSEQFSAFRD